MIHAFRGITMTLNDNNTINSSQLDAVRQNEFAIRFIKNPTYEVQLAAVKQNHYVIQYIKDPTYEVQLAAIQSSLDVIERKYV